MTLGAVEILARRSWDSIWIPDDLPEVTVRIAEVTGVDAPGSIARWGDGRARSFGLLEQPVNLVAAPYQLGEAEPTAPPRVNVDLCVLGQVCAGIQAENQTTVELEQ